MTDINVTAELEVDDGTGVTRQFSVEDLQVAQTGAAADTTLSTGLGTDGATPPTIAGTGIRGWLRAIYERLVSGVTVTGPATDAQLRATPLPITGTVTATVDETTLAKDATLTSGGQKTQVTNFPATQPVSGTVAVSNPTANPETGLAKDATLGSVVTAAGGPGSGVATITGGGSGIQGLLRMIWDTLRGSLTVTAAALTDGTQRIGGTVLVESSSTAKGYQQLTSTAAAATIASLCTGAALPTGATKVLLTPSAQVRVRDDGTNPSATVGYPIPASTEWRYDADQLAALKVYGAATIDAYFYA